MASYTSSQTGNFSASSTWGGGGVPNSDGDTFTITNGHTVTVDGSITVPTNGFGDSNIYGVLKAGSGAGILRMDGRLYINTNGLLWLQDGAEIQITGTSGETHGIYIENQDGASVIMEGSDGMPSTTISSTTNELSTSLPLTSASNFAAGEWIAIYDNSNTQNTNSAVRFRHEGFWIHDVSSNTVYLRELVGPEDVTVTSYSGSDIVVSNARKFKKNKRIVFGTGSNLNAKNITSINYSTNTITCDSSISGNPTGVTVYHSGTEKRHSSGEKVRKIATVTTAVSNSGTNTITVANANMFANNDIIFIENRSESASTSDYGTSFGTSYYHYTVQSVSSNTITLTANLAYKAVQGALVTRITRQIKVGTTSTNDYGYLYGEYYSSNYNRKLILKDVHFENWGSNNSNFYRGVVVRGYYSTASLPVTLANTVPSTNQGGWVEGLAIKARQTTTSDHGNLWFYDARYMTGVACIVLYGHDGIETWYEPGQIMTNCITAGTEGFICRHEGNVERGELAYLYHSRGTFGARVIIQDEECMGQHHWIIDGCRYGLEAPHSDGLFRRFKVSGTRYGNYSSGGGGIRILEGESKFLSAYSNQNQQGHYYAGQINRGMGVPRHVVFIENDFEYDSIKMFGFNAVMTWDRNEQAWFFERKNDNDNNPAITQYIYIPSNTEVYVSCKVKLVSGFSGTYPYLDARPSTNSLTENIISNSALNTSVYATDWKAAQYTSSAASDYEEKQITLTAVPYPQYWKMGVYSSNRNASEGFYVKDFQWSMDTPYPNQGFPIFNAGILDPNYTHNVVKQGHGEQKIRLGGRIK
tara:strand:- start:66 stop:2501 length:2436 start_codon:yes stop_codon:yes gene_type:complete